MFKLSKWTRRTGLVVLTALAMILATVFFTAAPVLAADPPSLGTAESFAVLAGAGITNTGTTSISGDVGTYSTITETGFDSVTFTAGTNHVGDAVTQQAKVDLVLAYNDAAGQSATTTYGAIYDLGGLTLPPGVYNDPSSFGITGTLTLDAEGNPNAVWIFQAGSTLTTASNSHVSLINNANAANVYWQVGTSATLNGTEFQGNILAHDSITLNTGAIVYGRALAQTGAVIMHTNVITKPVSPGPLMPELSTILLLGIGLLGLGVCFWLRSRNRHCDGMASQSR